MIAFGVLSIAGVYAIFVALIDHLLRQHSFNKLMQTLPALDTLEALLFHLIKVGFAVLTVSLVTGLVYVDDLFGQHLAHKTILSIFAWLIFATLLWGRWKRGWRGRVAVRMTLAGIALLLLSYFGSKLVLEVLLDRSWHLQGYTAYKGIINRFGRYPPRQSLHCTVHIDHPLRLFFELGNRLDGHQPLSPEALGQ